MPIELVIDARPANIGTAQVRRILPFRMKRMVGPFIFLDHMGPESLGPGKLSDIASHPHIGLATVTYLYEGDLIHRDSLGSEQRIRPGEINWMTAGSGIAHSERTPNELKQTQRTLHGLQAWVALPNDKEDTHPTFYHHEKAELPLITSDKSEIRVLVGEAFGKISPVEVFSPTIYLDIRLNNGGTFEFPLNSNEAGLYVVSGEIQVEEKRYSSGQMIVFTPGSTIFAVSTEDSSLALLGGSPLNEEKHIWWNFVASTKEKIELAKTAWRDRSFPQVIVEEEYIPLPEIGKTK